MKRRTFIFIIALLVATGIAVTAKRCKTENNYYIEKRGAWLRIWLNKAAHDKYLKDSTRQAIEDSVWRSTMQPMQMNDVVIDSCYIDTMHSEIPSVAGPDGEVLIVVQ